MSRFGVVNGDCLEVMARMPANTVDSIVTDPPYGLEFMGKEWDHGVPGAPFWREALRIAKPGAHLLAFGGTRTFHRLATAIEDAGWELRDTIMWVYGTGFPKSLDVSKAIDKAEGHWRGRAGAVVSGNRAMNAGNYERTPKGDPVTAAAAAWEGWGTALKPSWEPVIVARKPLEGTVASNVLKHGTGGINVDACRVPMSEKDADTIRNMGGFGRSGYQRTPGEALNLNKNPMPSIDSEPHSAGRWPANLVHDGSDEVLELFPSPHGAGSARASAPRGGESRGLFGMGSGEGQGHRHGDEGSAARFFYCAKASVADRDEGLDEMPVMAAHELTERKEGSAGITAYAGAAAPRKNTHPTVKPTELMRWCCRLVTPPGGTVLDPFAGSCSTGKAAILEGFNALMIEQDARYAEIGKARMEAAAKTENK